MTIIKKLLLTTSILAVPVMLIGQGQAQAPAPAVGPDSGQGGLDPALIYKPLSDSWLTYSGDYTGRRYSALTQINQSTVKNLSLAWVGRLSGPPAAGAAAGAPGFGGPGGRGGGGGGGGATIIGGEGTGDFGGGGGSPSIKGAILEHDGVLYLSAPDHAWAVDARDGHELWHYFWKTRGGTHIGSRGVGLWHNSVFLETPDNYLVSLDAKTGQERWHVAIASFEEQYFSTWPPIIIDNHVLVGTGNDLDMPGFLQSYDPITGKLQWKFYTVPMKAGDPGLDSWPSLEAARHGGGQVWIPGSFDPTTRLYIFGTGNPTPGYTGVGRKGDDLFTCSLVAVNVDTGKMAWAFQTSPHDTHDWDSTQTPILIDGTFNGKPAKMVLQATRNGYYFTIDRVSGESLVSSKLGLMTNWAKGIRPNGSPDPNPEKEATIPGSLVSPPEGGVTNWPPPAFSPDTGLFYINEHNAFNIVYLMDTDPRGSMGLAGKQTSAVGGNSNFLTAVDYKTGKIAWRHPYAGGGGAGLLTTAGKVVFSGDGSGNFVAFDAVTGKPIWHSRIGGLTNAPETYLIDGKQCVLVAIGDALYAFVVN
jgi:alcohol dehydrogenase (cytochrome c)